MNITKTLQLASLLSLGLLSGISSAWATNISDNAVNNCGTENCSARSIRGTVLLSSSFPMPWEGQIGVGQGECLRIDVTEQSQDLEAVLIGPQGTVYRNDNRSSGDARPLIKVNPAVRGWYTLQISQKDGAAVNTDFTLAFGRYVSTNATNCLPATPGF